MEVELSPRAEDYLKTIYKLSREKSTVRLSELARQLGVKMPSAIQMLRSLEEAGLLKYGNHGLIRLTEQGAKIAKKLYERHQLLKKFLIKYLNIDPEIAERDACGMEHHMSPETYERLIKFIEFMEGCPRGEPLWLTSFHYFLKHGKRPIYCFSETNAVIVNMSTLDRAEEGAVVKVVRVLGEPNVRESVLDKGIIPGVTVRVKRIKGKVIVEVDGVEVALSQEEARAVQVI